MLRGVAGVAGGRAVPQLDLDLVHREIGRLELDACAKAALLAEGDARGEAAAARLRAAARLQGAQLRG